MPPKLGRGRGRGSGGHQLSRQCSPSQPPSTFQHFPDPGWRQNQDERELPRWIPSFPPLTGSSQPSLSSIENVRDTCHGGNHPQSCATMGQERAQDHPSGCCRFGPDGEATLSTQSLSPPFTLFWPQQVLVTLGSALKEQVCRGDEALVCCSLRQARNCHKHKRRCLRRDA